MLYDSKNVYHTSKVKQHDRRMANISSTYINMRVSKWQSNSKVLCQSFFVLFTLSHSKVRFSTVGCLGPWPLSNSHLSLPSCHEGLYILSPVNLLLLLPCQAGRWAMARWKSRNLQVKWSSEHSERHTDSTPAPNPLLHVLYAPTDHIRRATC